MAFFDLTASAWCDLRERALAVSCVSFAGGRCEIDRQRKTPDWGKKCGTGPLFCLIHAKQCDSPLADAVSNPLAFR